MQIEQADGHWLVKNKYQVTHDASQRWRCTCPHFLYRRPDGGCKHIRAVQQHSQKTAYDWPYWMDAIMLATVSDHWHRGRPVLVRMFPGTLGRQFVQIFDGWRGDFVLLASQVSDIVATTRVEGKPVIAFGQVQIQAAYQAALEQRS